jgi:tRNA(Ile)-lysidine synthase
VTASPSAPLDAAPLHIAFERALESILARVVASGASTSPVPSIAIAYSGGLDSSVLLDLASHFARQRQIPLHAFHVHHGLSANADAWTHHCEAECSRLGVHFDCRRIMVEAGRDGVEQAARKARYAALGEMCRQHGVPLLLTAHHLDDQAETVLLQLLRGSGIAGLSGMEECNTAPALTGAESPYLARPLLHMSRATLESWCQLRGIAHVEDESNSDSRFARNALRGAIMPSVGAAFPGCQQRIARSARHAASAQRLLDELGAQDLAACNVGGMLNLDIVRRLSKDRTDNLFRYWLASKGWRMPSTAWLAEMQEQLFSAADDAQIKVSHPDGDMYRYRGMAHLSPRLEAPGQEAAVRFEWNGAGVMHFPTLRGAIHFDKREGQGIDRDWLSRQALVLRPRGPGDKLKPAPNRPTRAMKYHYQALGIPPWMRAQLPVLCTASGRIVYAAGVGHDSSNAPAGDIVLSWKSDLSGQ